MRRHDTRTRDWNQARSHDLLSGSSTFRNLWLCLTWQRIVILVLAFVAYSLVRNACTQYFANYPNRIHLCQVTHLTRRGRGLAPRSSALQLFPPSLGPKDPPPDIHTLLAQVIFLLCSLAHHILTLSSRDFFG